MSWRGAAKAIGIVVLPFLVFLGIAEVTLRVYLARHTFYDVEMSRYGLELKQPSRNPRIGHVHRSGGEARLMGVPVRINADGLRDDEHSIQRGAARRIVFLGDSLTFGWGVEKSETFADVLERELSKERPTEILNFGTGNYNTTQEVNLFLEKGLRYAPDEVVVFYFINDAEPVPARSRWWWLGHSRIVTFYWSRVKALLARLRPEARFEDYYAALYEEGAPGWEEAKRSFLELQRVCRGRGIGLRVVLLPELHSVADYPFAREHALVTGFLEAHGIESLDLAPFFRDQTDPRSLWVARDDAHPNARAHRLIAKYSLPFLREEPEGGWSGS